MKSFNLLFLSSLFALLSVTGQVSAREQVNVAFFSWPGYGFWFIAKEKDFVPELDLNISLIEDPYESFSMMSAGQLDVIVSTVEYGPIAVEENIPLRVVSYVNPSYGVDRIILAPGFNTAEDLIGQSVGVLEGGLTQIFMAIWLEDNGVSFDQVNYRNLYMDDAVSAMIGGNIAAAEFWEPYGSQVLELLDGSHVVATSSEDYWIETALLGDGIYMNETFIETRPEVAEKALEAWFRAVAFWKENPEEGNRIIAEGLRFAVSDVEMIIGATGEAHSGGIHIFSLEEASRFMGLMEGEPPFGLKNGQMHEHWDLTSTWWKKFGLISEVHESTAGIDFSVMENMLSNGWE